MTDISVIISSIGLLVAITNVIVQVIKKSFYNKIPTNIVTLVISEILSNSACLVYCQIYNISHNWCIIFSAIVVGFMVAYAAMFGYDKLIEIINWNKSGDS